jgi:hypothetical protein
VVATSWQIAQSVEDFRGAVGFEDGCLAAQQAGSMVPKKSGTVWVLLHSGQPREIAPRVWQGMMMKTQVSHQTARRE